MRVVWSVTAVAFAVAGCGGSGQPGPSDTQVQNVARRSFLSQTYSDHLFGADPQACSAHFRVDNVEVVDRQVAAYGEGKLVAVVVRLDVHAITDFPRTYSCSWEARSDTGVIGNWRVGETRRLTRTLTFAKWESGWRLSS